MNDKAWNVHRTNADKLQDLLNDHATKGYRIHSWIRGSGDSLYVIFRNEHVEGMMIHAGRLVDHPAVAAERMRRVIGIDADQVFSEPSPQPEASPSPQPAAPERQRTAHEDFLVGASER